jgi:plastocyanin
MLKGVCKAVAIASLIACGGGGSDSTSPPPSTAVPPPGGVSITNDAYTPASRTVTVGSNVSWVWHTCSGDVYTGQQCASHSVTFDDGISSPTQDQGSFNRSFTVAGTYPYHCTVHPQMTGTITVQ